MAKGSETLPFSSDDQSVKICLAMGWKVLVSYINGGGGGGGRNAPGFGEDEEEEDDPASMSVSDRSSSTSNVSPMMGGKRNGRTLVSFWARKKCSGGGGGSVDSLSEVSEEAPSMSPPSVVLRLRKSTRISRSGSIRVSDSPLHRGAVLGSPAFRRKRMRAAKR